MKKLSVSAALLFVSSKRCNSFQPALQIKNQKSSSNTSINLLDPTSLGNALSPVSKSIQSFHIPIFWNQNIEAEVFGDLAHIALDFVTFFSPDPIVLRFIILVGRIFSILSDYIPDHYLTPDEALFQFSMLILSGKMMWESSTILVSSYSKATSFKDKKIYLIFFLPVGFTWMQYKALSSDVFEWVELSPGKFILEEDDSILLTYKGDVYHYIDHLNIQRYGRCNSTRVIDMVGNLDFLEKLLYVKYYKKRKTKSAQFEYLNSTENQQSQITLRAGQGGSILLRIKMKKLLERANNDEDLSASTRQLLSNGIQNRLAISSDNETKY